MQAVTKYIKSARKGALWPLAPDLPYANSSGATVCGAAAISLAAAADGATVLIDGCVYGAPRALHSGLAAVRACICRGTHAHGLTALKRHFKNMQHAHRDQHLVSVACGRACWHARTSQTLAG